MAETTADELRDAAERCCDRWGCGSAGKAPLEVVKELLDDAQAVGKAYLALAARDQEIARRCRTIISADFDDEAMAEARVILNLIGMGE